MKSEQDFIKKFLVKEIVDRGSNNRFGNTTINSNQSHKSSSNPTKDNRKPPLSRAGSKFKNYYAIKLLFSEETNHYPPSLQNLTHGTKLRSYDSGTLSLRALLLDPL